ncbi:MAG: hypothetical protein HQM14_19400 [SAR324 cluster bacterium]|nr:hypothetical protein [SAR324 cluster bacterium]
MEDIDANIHLADENMDPQQNNNQDQELDWLRVKEKSNAVKSLNIRKKWKSNEFLYTERKL